MAETQPSKLKFRAAVTSPTLEINNGEYRRVFDAKDQPFAITGFSRKELDGDGKAILVDGKEVEVEVLTAAEEERLLRASGYFIGENEKEEAAQAVDGPKSKVQSPKSPTVARVPDAPATEAKPQ